MARPAVQLLVVLVWATQSIDAQGQATVCSAGLRAKTAVDELYCTANATSCLKDPTCCEKDADTCATEAADIVCGDGKYNTMEDKATDNDAKVRCCADVATCEQGTCPPGYEQVAENKLAECPGGPDTCSATIESSLKPCCKIKSSSCLAWEKKVAMWQDACVSGMSLKSHDTIGSTPEECCMEDVYCPSHACPSTHQTIPARVDNTVSAEQRKCPQNKCSDGWCCQPKAAATTCGGISVSCTSRKFVDPAKANLEFGSDPSKCCSDRAKCKDSASVVVADGAFMAAAPASLVMAGILIYSADQ